MMDAQQFLTEFGHIANARGGVARLRDLIFSLAYDGKLLDDLEAVEPTHLAKVADFVMGQAPPGNDCNTQGEGAVFVKAGEFGVSHPIVREWTTKPLKLAKQGDVLICVVGATVGKLNLAIDCAIGRSVAAIRPRVGLLTKYLYFMLMPFTLSLRSGSRGSAQGVIGKAELSSIKLRIPTVEEQSRIVAKVEDLMVLCDQLEEQHQRRRTNRNELRRLTLHHLINGHSPRDLLDGWHRLQANFDLIVREPEDVDAVVDALKDLAVRGLLVEKTAVFPDLDVIRADCLRLRARYIDEGLMRRQKLVGMAEYETTYPDHWAVVAFDEVAVVIGGVTKGRNLRGKETVVCPYLAVANVQRGRVQLDGLKSIEITVDELAKYRVEEGDLLITEGGDWDKVGRTAIWRGGVENCLHQNHVFKARVPSSQLSNQWVELVFNSRVGRDYFGGASKQTTNLASINMAQLRSFPLPLPPLGEQQRILAALSQLTFQCTEWRQQLERQQHLSALLANAVVSTFTGVTNKQEEDPVRAPQTELIARLRLGVAPHVSDRAPLSTILVRYGGEMPARDLWQRFGGEIDAFYAQLKAEVTHGWIAEPAVAEVREIPFGAAGA